MCNLKWVRRPGVIHDRVFLEAISISCLSSLWFQWSLSVEGMKERKKKYKERDGIWEKMKERKKKKMLWNWKRRNNTIEDQDLPPLLWCSSWKEDESHVVLMWIRGKQRATQQNFFFFFVKLHTTQWITFWLWILGFLLQTII